MRFKQSKFLRDLMPESVWDIPVPEPCNIVVVFHDSRKAVYNMSCTLPRVLEYLRNRGMKSGVIEI